MMNRTVQVQENAMKRRSPEIRQKFNRAFFLFFSRLCKCSIHGETFYINFYYSIFQFRENRITLRLYLAPLKPGKPSVPPRIALFVCRPLRHRGLARIGQYLAEGTCHSFYVLLAFDRHVFYFLLKYTLYSTI